MNDDTKLDKIFEAFGHTKRRGMITALAYRPATISQLAYEQQLSLPAMHKHVNLLFRAGLIRRKKVGRTNFVALKPATLKLAQDWAMQFNTAWGNDHETLENYIASLEHGHALETADVRTNKGKRSKTK